MRSCKRHTWVVMLLLILGVAARETPEIMTLSDDVSNDGIAVGFEDPISQMTSRCVSRPERLPSTAAQPSAFIDVKKRTHPISPLVLPARAGKGLLRSVSLQRV